jgi:hypothetical protein
MVKGAVLVTPPRLAEIVAVTLAGTATVEMVKVAVVAPAATVTLEGVVAAALSLASVIVVPPAGAALEIVTVPVLDWPPLTVAGATVNESKVGGT